MNIILKFSLLLFLVLTLVSCVEKIRQFELYSKIDNGRELSVDTKIKMYDSVIGSVVSHEVSNSYRNVLIKINISKKVEIPKDSDFLIVLKDLFENKEVIIKPGKAKQFFSSDDTIQFINNNKSGIDKINLNSVKGMDSLVNEYRMQFQSDSSVIFFETNLKDTLKKPFFYWKNSKP